PSPPSTIRRVSSPFTISAPRVSTAPGSTPKASPRSAPRTISPWSTNGSRRPAKCRNDMNSLGTKIDRRLTVTGAALGGLAVMLGAFGAHALKSRLGPEELGWWQTAVQYQMGHALAVLG